MDEAAVALGGSARWGGTTGKHEFALFNGLGARLLALVCLAIEFLGYGCGATHLAEGEDFKGEVACLVADLELVANADFACRLGDDVVGEDASELAGLGG